MNSRAEHFGWEEVDLEKVEFTRKLLACIPSAIAHRYRVIPVAALGSSVRIALADPSDLDALDSVHAAIQRDLEVVVAEQGQIDAFIPRLYPKVAG